MTAPDLATLEAQAATCTACDLYRNATQTVFGQGPQDARVMLVGEQPGDQEDLEGEPFVGPAGKVLADALAQAGLAREGLYVTNAVKHFKWKPRGKRRIHDQPNRTEVVACKRWLDAEIDALRPEVLVALGATAGQALFGSSFRVGASRGQDLQLDDGTAVIATIHPAAVLRARSGELRQQLLAGLVEDLRRVASRL